MSEVCLITLLKEKKFITQRQAQAGFYLRNLFKKSHCAQENFSCLSIVRVDKSYRERQLTQNQYQYYKKLNALLAKINYFKYKNVLESICCYNEVPSLYDYVYVKKSFCLLEKIFQKI